MFEIIYTAGRIDWCPEGTSPKRHIARILPIIFSSSMPICYFEVILPIAWTNVPGLDHVTHLHDIIFPPQNLTVGILQPLLLSFCRVYCTPSLEIQLTLTSLDQITFFKSLTVYSLYVNLNLSLAFLWRIDNAGFLTFFRALKPNRRREFRTIWVDGHPFNLPLIPPSRHCWYLRACYQCYQWGI